MPQNVGSRPPPPRDTRPPPPPSLGPGPVPEIPPAGRPSWRGWVVLGVLLATVGIWEHFASNEQNHPPISYTAFYKAVSEQQVESVTIRGQTISGRFKKPTTVEGHSLELF